MVCAAWLWVYHTSTYLSVSLETLNGCRTPNQEMLTLRASKLIEPDPYNIPLFLIETMYCYFLDYSIKDLDGFVVRYTDLWVFDILTSRICRAKCHVPKKTADLSRARRCFSLWRCRLSVRRWIRRRKDRRTVREVQCWGAGELPSRVSQHVEDRWMFFKLREIYIYI